MLMNPTAMFKDPSRDSLTSTACDPATRHPDKLSLATPGAPTDLAAHPASQPLDHCLVTLVQRMAARDKTALDAFYEATVGHVYGLAKRMIRDASATEDIVVEVYFQIWESAMHYDASRASVLTWLLTVCRSRTLDELRKRRHDTMLAQCTDEIANWQADQATPSGLDLLLAVEAGSRLQQALAQLPPVDRQLLGLAYFRDLSHRDISAVMRLPLGTIKSKIRRALQALALMLAPDRARTHEDDPRQDSL